jgi:hypothetical protein
MRIPKMETLVSSLQLPPLFPHPSTLEVKVKTFK